MFDESMKCKIFKDYNISFDEKGSSWGVLRKVQWYKEGKKEPDESKAKIEIRKIYQKGNEETIGKGYSFSTEEGPGELAIGLISAGFGDTKKILKEVRKRKDIKEAIENINNEDDESSDGETFDIRDLLIGLDNSDDE